MKDDDLCQMSDLPPAQCGHCKKDPEFDAVRDTAGSAEGEVAAEYEVMVARFRGSRCSKCHTRINIGDYMYRNHPSQGYGYYHEDCNDRTREPGSTDRLRDIEAELDRRHANRPR